MAERRRYFESNFSVEHYKRRRLQESSTPPGEFQVFEVESYWDVSNFIHYAAIGLVEAAQFYPETRRITLLEHGNLEELLRKQTKIKGKPGMQFNGQFRNFCIEIADQNFDIVPSQDRNHEQEVGTNFIMTAEMHSTGRGVVGLVSREFCLYTQPLLKSRFDKSSNNPVVLVRHEAYNKADTNRSIRRLMGLSRGIASIVFENAVNNAVSAGLGSLGKRK